MDLSERVKWAIDYVAEKNGLSNAKIARIVGSKTNTINRYRSKQTSPKNGFIERFCLKFEFSYSWIAEGDGEPLFNALKETEVLPKSEESEELRTEAGPRSGPGELKHPGMSGELLSYKCLGIAKIDAEISLQKLALLAGIKIDRNWVANLAKVISVAPWKISISILNKQMNEELVKKIEDCGYFRNIWAVERISGRAAGNMPPMIGSNSELVKMAEKILHSGTIHATSLAMNIISLRAALAVDDDGEFVKGACAIDYTDGTDRMVG